MKQISFSQAEFAGKKRVTWRERLAAEREHVTPWQAVLAMIEPHYRKSARRRPPIRLERMLPVSLVEQPCGHCSNDPPAEPGAFRRWPLKGAYSRRARSRSFVLCNCHTGTRLNHDATAIGELCR